MESFASSIVQNPNHAAIYVAGWLSDLLFIGKCKVLLPTDVIGLNSHQCLSVSLAAAVFPSFSPPLMLHTSYEQVFLMRVAMLMWHENTV